MVENVILDVCNFLKSKHILIPAHNHWLRGSIACFRETNGNCSPNQLKEFVFSQWKLADLKEISAPSLPNNCQTALKLTLPGKYAVQINYIINIGESFYKQLQKIRRPAAEDNLSVDSEKEKVSNEVQSNRTLKFEITDGVVTLLGFEDKLIRKLVEPFVPGVKAILSGPIECRKGVLFLKNENIDLLGGEVDTLHIPNATENLLARALKQPENPDPYRTFGSNNIDDQDAFLDEDEAFLQIPVDIEANHIKPNLETSSKQSIITPRSISNSISGILNDNGSLFNNSVNTSSFNPSRTGSTYGTGSRSTYDSSSALNSSSHIEQNQFDDSVVEIDDDEEFALIAAETASLAEQKVTSKTPPNTKQTSLNSFFKSSTSSSDKSGSSSSKRSTNEGRINIHERQSKTSKVSSTKEHIAKTNNDDLRKQLEESYSSLMESDSKSNDISYTSIFQKDNNKEKILSNSSQQSDKTLLALSKQNKPPTVELSFPPKKYPTTLTLRGSVQNIVQKLTISDKKWNLTALMKMRGVELEMDFSSEALEKVIGMSASDLQAKRKILRTNPELKSKIDEILKSSQRRILQLDCDMKVHFTSYIGKPLILDILDQS